MAFVYRPIFETVAYPVGPPGSAEKRWEEEFAGFTADVLVNPNGRDVREIDRARRALVEIKGDEAEAEYLQVLAKRVPRWSFRTRNTAGEVVDVPAPGESEGNWEAFYLLPPSLLAWLAQLIPVAHIPRAKALWLGLDHPGGQTSTPALDSPDDQSVADAAA